MQDKRHGHGQKIVRIYHMGRIGVAVSAVFILICVLLLCTSRATDSYFSSSVDFYVCGDGAFLTRLEGENYIAKEKDRGKLLSVQKISSQRIFLGKDKEKAQQINGLYFYPLTIFSAVSRRLNEFYNGEISEELLLKSVKMNIGFFNSFYMENQKQIESSLEAKELYVKILSAVKMPPITVSAVNQMLYNFAVSFVS